MPMHSATLYPPPEVDGMDLGAELRGAFDQCRFVTGGDDPPDGGVDLYPAMRPTRPDHRPGQFAVAPP